MESFRFRIVRNIQDKSANVLDLRNDIQNLRNLKKAITPTTTSNYPPEPIEKLPNWFTRLSWTLAQNEDQMDIPSLENLLPCDWQNQISSTLWGQFRNILINSLETALSSGLISNFERDCRLLLLHDLLTTMAADKQLPSDQQVIKSSLDVLKSLRRQIILPDQYYPKFHKFSQKHSKIPKNTSPFLGNNVGGNAFISIVARQPGFTDLYIVKDEWNRYEPGELAQVINVLPGETFDNRMKHFSELDQESSTSTNQTTTEETETSHTTSSSLSESATQDVSMSIGANAQVQTSGQYGPTQVQTSIGVQVQVSQSDSDTRAMTISAETMQRAAKTVTEAVIKTQLTRTITKDTSVVEHKLQNTSENVTVGLYRWLNEIHRVQLVRYPNRLVVEFEIPEPGAWLRWAIDNKPTTAWDNPDPGNFRQPNTSVDLQPEDITRDNWPSLAALWRVQGLTPPPPQNVTLSTQLTAQKGIYDEKLGDIPPQTSVDSSLTVPDGYVATIWVASFAFRSGYTVTNGELDMGSLYAGVGGGDPMKFRGGTGDIGGYKGDIFGGIVGSINKGDIPVVILGDELADYALIFNVSCDLTAEAFSAWRQDTYDQLLAGYQKLINAYHQERDTRAQQEGSTSGLTDNPDLNKSRVINELRRLIIQDLIGESFTGFDVLNIDANTSEPSIDLVNAEKCAPIIQFFEEVFEWENLVYIFYPYYWGRHNQWIVNATSASADPEFDKFLNAGSVRVVVPARPGFENIVNYFLHYGEIWNGDTPPAPGDWDYLSVAQEIQDLEIGPKDGTPVGSSWEISLPTTLLWAGTDSSTLPTNPNAKIPPPS